MEQEEAAQRPAIPNATTESQISLVKACQKKVSPKPKNTERNGRYLNLGRAGCVSQDSSRKMRAKGRIRSSLTRSPKPYG